jgi:hypothetical protein
MNREDFQKAYAKLVARAWSDADFKQDLISDPIRVFEENGIQVPEGADIKVVENCEDLTHFILPVKPDWDCGGIACGMEGLCICYMFHIWKMWFRGACVE